MVSVQSFVILAVLVAVLYSKWLIVMFLYSLIALSVAADRLPGARLRRLLRMPLGAADRITRYGVSRFVMYNISVLPSVHLRRWLYKGAGVRFGKNVVVHFRTEIRCPERLTLCDGTIIGDNAIPDARRGLTLGKNVNLSSDGSIYTLQHDHRAPLFRCPPEDKVKFSVEIDDRVWLGSNVIVLPGVHIGEGAVSAQELWSRRMSSHTPWLQAFLPGKWENVRTT